MVASLHLFTSAFTRIFQRWLRDAAAPAFLGSSSTGLGSQLPAAQKYRYTEGGKEISAIRKQLFRTRFLAPASRGNTASGISPAQALFFAQIKLNLFPRRLSGRGEQPPCSNIFRYSSLWLSHCRDNLLAARGGCSPSASREEKKNKINNKKKAFFFFP